MSRSYKKTPICGITCAKSEKADKRFWNRSFRKKRVMDDDEEIAPTIRHTPQEFAKDGRQYVRDDEFRKKIIRK